MIEKEAVAIFFLADYDGNIKNFFSFFQKWGHSLGDLVKNIEGIGDLITEASLELEKLRDFVGSYAHAPADSIPFLSIFTIFILSIFVGYYVVWRVTPALHSPLMAVTNALSSVIIVGGIMTCGAFDGTPLSRILGFLAVLCASINIFGGFLITHRMLGMFQKSASRPLKKS